MTIGIYKIALLSPFTSNKRRAIFLKHSIGKMGENCEVFRHVNFGSEPYLIEFGDNVRVTYGVSFITHDGGVHVLRKVGLINSESVFGKIIIGNNVFIGNEAMILPGVTIGNNVIIGARSVITKSVPDNCIAAGTPAKILGNIFDYYKKNIGKYIDISQMNYCEKRSTILSLGQAELITK